MTRFGRSTFVSSLRIGEDAIFSDGIKPQLGLAFSAKRASDDYVVLAHIHEDGTSKLIITDGGGWRHVPAWVLPSEVGIFVDFSSRVLSDSLPEEAYWTALRLDHRGFSYLPVYNPTVGRGVLRAWYNLDTRELESDVGDGIVALQCFPKWGMRMFGEWAKGDLWRSSK